MTFEDFIRMQNGQGSYGAPVRAVGQGGSRNPFALSGYGGTGRTAWQGGAASLPAGTNLNMEWLGRNLDTVSKMPRDQMMAIARTAGQNQAAGVHAPAPTPTPQYFGNDWSGMRRNIGWGPPSNGLAGLAGMFGGAAGGGMGGGYGGGFGGQGMTLGSLLGLLGGR